MKDRWVDHEAPADELDRVVYLSNLVGAETSLVQPGGGNTSIKLTLENAFGDREPCLAVKGSGTDLRTIRRGGFTRLSMAGLARFRARLERETMSDDDLVRLMRACMLDVDRDPAPSVETPLHSILPHRVIVHTHDVATMSLTNVPDELGRKLVAEVFGGEIVYVPYVRPGFPLAAAVARLAGGLPANAHGLALAHHGIVVWADEVEECYRRLIHLVNVAERAIDAAKAAPGAAAVPAAPQSRANRANVAATLLPAIRGALGASPRTILHWDGSDDVLAAIEARRFKAASLRGMATPEHILRAGRLPVWLDLDWTGNAAAIADAARTGIADARKEYDAYHLRQAKPDEKPLEDWAKVFLVPGFGMVTAFKDKASAVVANVCYRAVIQSISNAELLGEFRFLSEDDVFEFERWPLERRKVEEQIRQEAAKMLVPRRIVLVVGGGSGIGEAAALHFAEEGAHVVVADLDEENARRVAEKITSRFSSRATAFHVDVCDEASVRGAVDRAVIEFGGLDCLFYTAGLAPRFAPVEELRREDFQAQLDVHYLGAMLAIGEAARIMRLQGLGGSIVCSVSKAALAPGLEAAAYGGSKAALQHALRVAALELGPAGIRVNAINADQIDTPLFRRFVEARARSQGRSVEDQLERYRTRNALGASSIPPRDVAAIAVLLASDRFRFTTGGIVTIDGGLGDAMPR